LVLSVPEIERKTSSSFSRQVRIDQKQALTIIDHLAESGLLDRAHKTGELEKLPMPCYLLTVQAGDLDVTEVLGWDLAMLRQFDGLRSLLSGEAAKSMDLLVGRLSGLRRVWEKKADVSTSFVTSVGREDSAVHFVSEGDSIVVQVTSKFGIDKATIKRKAKEWPKSMILRLHLTGLESLKIGNGSERVSLYASDFRKNTGGYDLLLTMSFGDRGVDDVHEGNGGALGRGFPHWTEVRVVGSERKIPLKQGWFEVPVPVGLFKKNPEEITLEWVDFHRK
jgi:hypothetical protein